MFTPLQKCTELDKKLIKHFFLQRFTSKVILKIVKSKTHECMMYIDILRGSKLAVDITSKGFLCACADLDRYGRP